MIDYLLEIQKENKKLTEVFNVLWEMTKDEQKESFSEATASMREEKSAWMTKDECIEKLLNMSDEKFEEFIVFVKASEHLTVNKEWFIPPYLKFKLTPYGDRWSGQHF